MTVRTLMILVLLSPIIGGTIALIAAPFMYIAHRKRQAAIQQAAIWRAANRRRYTQAL